MTLLLYTAQITIYTVLAMKNSQKFNPSKYDILNWMNSILPKHFKRLLNIEQMGTGVHYLYALSVLRPGSVRVDRILNQPQNEYEISCNLKYLSSVFQKLQLSYSFQIEKVAQMKYQDNYHLASFLFKMQNNLPRSNPQVSQQLAKTSESTKKVKIVLPRNPVQVPLKKIQTNPVTKETIMALRHQPEVVLQKICEEKSAVQEAKSQKLTKIARLLNLERKEEKVYSQKTKSEAFSTLQRSQPPKLSCLSESFRRFLRPSICERSKYLKQFVDQNAPSHNFPAEVRCENSMVSNNQNQIQRFQQLLSQKKQGQKNKEQTATEDNRQQNLQNEQLQEQQLMYGL